MGLVSLLLIAGWGAVLMLHVLAQSRNGVTKGWFHSLDRAVTDGWRVHSLLFLPVLRTDNNWSVGLIYFMVVAVCRRLAVRGGGWPIYHHACA
jgi:hypothetical protein